MKKGKIKKSLAHKKSPFPLFPINWIKHDTGFFISRNPYQYKERIKCIHREYNEKIMDIELPDDRSEDSIYTFKEIARRGGDPNYIDAQLKIFKYPFYILITSFWIINIFLGYNIKGCFDFRYS